MTPNIKISLDTSQYRLPTQEDIASAKQFILRREDYARELEAKADECLANAAQEIVTICYKYNVDPKKFSISSQYNEKMMAEIAEVMDNAEEEILDLIYDYSTAPVSDGSSSGRKEAIAAWIALLGRGNRNLQGTLDGYLYKTMKDWEAAIAALRWVGIGMSDAVTKVKSHLHSIYTMPEVRATFDNADDFNATCIRNKGVQKGAVGISNNGSTNVTNMAKLTLQMAWMKELSMEHEEDGAAGYYVLRGSSYPCETCDSMVGFHKMEDIDGYPPYHGHCCCYVIPIYGFDGKTTNNEHTQQEDADAIAQARAKFDAYSEEWEKEYFNPSNGGFNVYHKKHQFSDVKPNGADMSGGQAEKHVGRLLADFAAKQVEFLPENSNGGGKPDIGFDKTTWDVKYIPMANEGTIRKYYKDARKAQAVIFYSETKRDKDVLTAINREKGRFVSMGRDLSELPTVYVMNIDGVLRLLE
jgi:hypothetical protein